MLASSEVHPFSKTGGLADMVGALGKALAHAGHETRIITPLYRGIREKYPQIRRVDWWFDLPLGARRVQAELWSLEIENGPLVYFIQQPEFYLRAGLYQENDLSYPDNAERFIFFSKCIAHLARHLPWRPDVVHINDWQTGFVPALDFAATARGRVGESAADLPDHSQSRLSGHFPARRVCADQPAGGIFHGSKARSSTDN